MHVGLALVAPPGVDSEKIKILRDAYVRVVTNKEYVAEAAKRGFNVGKPNAGETIAAYLQKAGDEKGYAGFETGLLVILKFFRVDPFGTPFAVANMDADRREGQERWRAPRTEWNRPSSHRRIRVVYRYLPTGDQP